MTLLVIITLVLLAIAGHQLLRVVELSRTIKGVPEWKATEADNRAMAYGMMTFLLVFFAFCYWQFDKYLDKLLPNSASYHGDDIDWLMNFNLIICTIVFVITNVALFYFAFKYYGRKNTKAYFFPHDNRLEMAWTVVPAIVLAFIIFFGLYYWNQIMDDKDNPNALKIELYAKQFDWTARYPGADKQYGKTDFTMCSGSNMVGLDTNDAAAKNDVMTKEIHLVVDTEVIFTFRSRDVIHSAYMPHFRAQMNCVPGQITMFRFRPKYTTVQMRKDPYVMEQVRQVNETRRKLNKDPYEFDYVLLCNKICGASHYSMQLKIIVETQKEFNEWMAKQKPFMADASTPAPKNP
ncbi:MAG: cytochrome c oxidase subunit II [Bacteroidia bacterium]|nr:cytochrome c oxidase subunit II [Bacteroidia bacterium]